MPKPTRTLIGEKARKAVLDGVNAIYEPVRRTLGPQGRNALLYRTLNRGSRITNDGYTVAETQEPRDIFVRMAGEAFKESCKRTNQRVGDGTTTTTVIAGKLYNDVHKLLSDGQSDFIGQKGSRIGVMTLRKRILETTEKVKSAIKESAKKVETLEDLEKIAIVSVEDVALGKTIAKMAWEVGLDGFIDTTEGYKGEVETEVIKGMRFPAKVAAKAFVNNPARYEMVAVDCPVLVTNYALDNARDVADPLNAIHNNASGTSKVIVVAPSFSENVLVNMVNAVKGGYFIYPVAAPSLRTEQFEDLAIYCGAQFIDKAKGKKLQNVTNKDLGFIEKLIVKDTDAREEAVATGGAGTKLQVGSDVEAPIISPVQERAETLKKQLLEQKQENYKKIIERRIASMASAVGVIRVGDSTQASALYRKLKIEDAVYACKAALRGGYVKGGGLCLKEIAETLPEDDITRSAFLAPYEQIQASVDGGVEIPDDVIDPAEAVYYAVEHAAQVVANLATVEVITAELEDALPEEGGYAMARAMNELVISTKRHYGQIKENEEEMERDRLNGMTDYEIMALDNG